METQHYHESSDGRLKNTYQCCLCMGRDIYEGINLIHHLSSQTGSTNSTSALHEDIRWMHLVESKLLTEQDDHSFPSLGMLPGA